METKSDQDNAAEESLKRAQYELLELVKLQGGLHIDAGTDSNQETSTKIALVSV